MKSYLTSTCALVEQQLMTPEDLSKISDGQVFKAVYLQGNFFDYMGTYLFVAKKGGNNDWAVYGIAVMTPEESVENRHITPQFSMGYTFTTLLVNAAAFGNKLTSKDNIMLAVPCTEEMYQLYRR
jgi:hypothetical protein